MAQKIRQLLGFLLAEDWLTAAGFLFLFSLTPIVVAIASLSVAEDVVCSDPIETPIPAIQTPQATSPDGKTTLTWSDAFLAEVMELELHARRVISLTP